MSGRIALLLLLALPATAVAAEPDLAVRHEPAPTRAPTLRIRKQAQATPPAAAGPETDGAVRQSAPDSQGGGFLPSARELEEKAVFKVQIGYGLDDTPLSGDPMRNGVVPGDAPPLDASGEGARSLRASNNYLLGDAVLGTRGVPRASLNTYFMSQFRLGIDGASAYATRYDSFDAQGDNAILVHAAYGEYTWKNLFIRAGRQYRYGAALFVTQFDGVSLVYQQPDWEAGVYVGRRSPIYVDEVDLGVVGGASARVRLQRINGWPVALAADFLELDGERHYLELSGRAEVGPGRVTVSARALDNGDGDGFGVGRVGARLRYPASRKLYLLGDADVILSHDAAYDYLSPNPTDVVDLGATGIALALPEPGDTLRLGGGAMLGLGGGLDAYGFGRVNLASAAGLDNTWFEVGAALSMTLGRSLLATGQLKLRVHSLDAASREPGSAFDDLSGSGVLGFREAAGELRYRAGLKKYSIAVGGWARAYDIRTPYVEIDNDGRFGGRADAEVWLDKRSRLRAVAEMAQPSPAFAPDLETMYSFRLIGEAQF